MTVCDLERGFDAHLVSGTVTINQDTVPINETLDDPIYTGIGLRFFEEVDPVITSPGLVDGPAIISEMTSGGGNFNNLLFTGNEIIFDWEAPSALVFANQVATGLPVRLGSTGLCMTGRLFGNPCTPGGARATGGFEQFDTLGFQMISIRQSLSGRQIIATARDTAPAPVPLPARLGLLGAGLVMLMRMRRPAQGAQRRTPSSSRRRSRAQHGVVTPERIEMR